MMPREWRFLLDRGVNYRTKRRLLDAGFAAVFQLEDVGLTGLAVDPDIFAEAQQHRLILITKDTDFLKQQRYALGHEGILYVRQSRTELNDTLAVVVDLAAQYSSLANMRFTIEPGGHAVRSSP
jgi:predicted nuclease of predicted toxin-antitoxin system